MKFDYKENGENIVLKNSEKSLMLTNEESCDFLSCVDELTSCCVNSLDEYYVNLQALIDFWMEDENDY